MLLIRHFTVSISHLHFYTCPAHDGVVEQAIGCALFQHGQQASRLVQIANTNQVGYICLMEKRKPHCPLAQVKALVADGKVRTTQSARLGATALGLNLADMLAVVVALTSDDFYKSMTTHADHTVWQDVYRPMTQAGDVYLKLTVIEDVLIVSFKEL